MLHGMTAGLLGSPMYSCLVFLLLVLIVASATELWNKLVVTATA